MPTIKPSPAIATGLATLISLTGAAWSAPDTPSATATTGQTTALPEVRITGKAQAVQTLIDRKVYNVSSDLQSVTGTAADILNSLPSVEVDIDGNVSLRGDSKVMILVDGKPSAQLTGARAGDGLLQFAANDIEKIEVMTTAPAEYTADGTGGVINIITKKTRKAGASGSLLANAGNHQRFVIGASGAYNTGPWSLSGGLGLRQDDRQRMVASSLSAIGPSTPQNVTSREQLDEHIRRLIPSAKGGLEYRFNDSQSLGLDFNLRQRSGDRYFDQHNDNGLSAGPLASASLRHSDGHEWSRSDEQSLRFKQKLQNPDDTLELSLHRTTDVEHERYDYHNTATLPAYDLSEDHLYLNHDLTSSEFALDYRATLTDNRVLKLGFSVRRDDNGFTNAGDTVDLASGQAVDNLDLTNQFGYRQTVQAIYGSYQQALGDWSFLAGVRAEHTVSTGQQLTTGVTHSQNYGGIYPSLHLERAFGDEATLSLGYSRRLSRPDPEILNPFVDHQDIHNLRAGNPDLLPQDTQALEVGYRVEANKQNYGVTGYLRYNRNATTDVTQLLSPDVVLSTKANLPKSMATGLEFSTDGPLTSVLSYRLSGNLFHSEIDATALGTPGLKSTTGLNLKSSLDYRPTAVDTAQLSFSRADKRLTPQGYVDGINLVNFGYKRQLQPDLSLVMTVSDVFNGQKFRRVLDTATFTQTYQRQQLGRAVYVGVAYAFGAPKKSKSAGFEYEQ